MKIIAFSATPDQILIRTKTVTRRASERWMTLKPGQILRAVRKSQGLKKGEHVETLAMIRVTSVSRIPVSRISAKEIAAEGFPGMKIPSFLKLLRRLSPELRKPGALVTRIEFSYLD